VKIELRRLGKVIVSYGQQAITQEAKAHLPDITLANLRRKTQKARVIYKLFVNIGVRKIKRVKTYSADVPFKTVL
jgi:hypothetical protein